MLIELAPVGVQCAEDADFDARSACACMPEHTLDGEFGPVSELMVIFLDETF
ncbi:hypothetical protein D3C80_1098840 [compost metagenome]